MLCFCDPAESYLDNMRGLFYLVHNLPLSGLGMTPSATFPPMNAPFAWVLKKHYEAG